MCICINCAFYDKCWIKNGLNKLPKVHTNSLLQLDLKNNISNKTFLYLSATFKINLNIFTKKQEYEFDVVECEIFCENPGKWID